MSQLAEPGRATAGDTWEWRRAFDAYKASAGWSLSYVVVNGASSTTFSSVSDGDAHQVTVPMATTAAIAAGEYTLIGFATDGTERHEIYRGHLVVDPDPLTIGASDLRSPARIMLEKIDAALDAAGNDPVASYSIDDTNITRRTYVEMIQLRAHYAKQVSAENAAQQAQRYGKSGVYSVRL